MSHKFLSQILTKFLNFQKTNFQITSKNIIISLIIMSNNLKTTFYCVNTSYPMKFYNKLYHFILFLVVFINSTGLLVIMSSGQKRGSCGHVMPLFDNHKKCARCREKGVGDDPCVKKLDCQICKAFTTGHPDLQVQERKWRAEEI